VRDLQAEEKRLGAARDGRVGREGELEAGPRFSDHLGLAGHCLQALGGTIPLERGLFVLLDMRADVKRELHEVRLYAGGGTG
jgi:hypothetical protein